MSRKVNASLARARRAQAVAEPRFAFGARHAGWAAAAVLAFAVPFGMNTLRGGEVAPAAASAAPPAISGVPALPALHRVAALPAPPRVQPRRRTPRPAAPSRPAATTAPTPVATTAPAPPPAPAAAPTPPKSFDLSG
jgi:hypothetical protein